MVINRLTTGNTFQQWVFTTQRASSYLNQITDGTIANVYSNTNVTVGEELIVNGNVLVTGTFILDEIDFNDLTLGGNLTVGVGTTATNGEFTNLVLNGNVATLNVTTDLTVGTDLRINRELNTDILNTANLSVQGSLNVSNANVTFYGVNVTNNASAVNINTSRAGNNITSLVTDGVAGNLVTVGSLTIGQNVATINTTNNLYVGDDLVVYGNINVSGDASLGDVPSVNISSANITILVGDARNQIYETINNSTAAVTVAANISNFIAFAIGLG